MIVKASNFILMAYEGTKSFIAAYKYQNKYSMPFSHIGPQRDLFITLSTQNHRMLSVSANMCVFVCVPVSFVFARLASFFIN